MTRNRGKKALYEVISEKSQKNRSKGILEHLHPPKINFKRGAKAKSAPPVVDSKPKQFVASKMFQIWDGKVEISIPYQLAIAILLAFLLIILVAYRLGQSSGENASTGTSQADITKITDINPVGKADSDKESSVKSPPADNAEVTAAEIETSKISGSNRIVIQTHEVRTQLEPVKDYFDSHGIPAEIRNVKGKFFLITRQGFTDNPERPMTEGYLLKQKIIDLGRGYKSPTGYRSFGSEPFQDAYGMKFED